MADDPTIVRNPTLTLNVLSEEQYQSIPIPSDQEIYLTPDDTDEKLAGKQDKLVEGTNISLVDNLDGTTTISSTASESFFRGPFTTWTNVPATGSESNYLVDIHGSHIPQPTDFITIADTSDYVSSEPLGTVVAYMNSMSLVTSINGGAEVTHPAIDGEYYIDEPTSGEHIFRVVSQFLYASNVHTLYAEKTIVYGGNTYAVGDLVKSFNRSEASGDQRSTFNYYAVYSGAWRFYYDVNAIWGTDGKLGWKPQYQIENVLPIATSTESGIAKLYTTTGQNTDGSVTQKLVTDELGKKQDTLTEGTGISIDEHNVISATFSESYFRGKFSTWGTVPTDYRNYYPDYTGSTKPTRTDYMVVEDPSSYVKPGMPIKLYNEPSGSSVAYARFVFGVTDVTLSHVEVQNSMPAGIILGTAGSQIKVTYNTPLWKITPLDVPIIVDGVEKPVGEVAFSWSYAYPSQETLIKELNFTGQGGYKGTWRFSYQSDDWDTSGKNGWEPEYQIEDVLPIATDTVAGITKLYTTTGQNTDGTITQKAITDALGTKQNTLTAGNNITIDANSKIDAADKTLVSFVIWEDEE